MKYVIPPSASSEALGEAYAKYFDYLESLGGRLPTHLGGFVLESWYYIFMDHRCPHDSRLVEAVRSRDGLMMTFFNAKHESVIMYRYLNFDETASRIRFDQGEDFIFYFDEFRLVDSGHVVHEIRSLDGAAICITCSDVVLEILKKSDNP